MTRLRIIQTKILKDINDKKAFLIERPAKLGPELQPHKLSLIYSIKKKL